MHRFVTRHAHKITGILRGFGRLVFRGHLLPLCHKRGVGSFLSSQGVLLKHFGKLVESVTAMIRDGAVGVTDRLQVPVATSIPAASGKRTWRRRSSPSDRSARVPSASRSSSRAGAGESGDLASTSIRRRWSGA